MELTLWNEIHEGLVRLQPFSLGLLVLIGILLALAYKLRQCQQWLLQAPYKTPHYSNAGRTDEEYKRHVR